MKPPLMIELYAGTFGWSQSWLEMGGRSIGFDLEHLPHHGPVPAGADLVLQDVLTLHGSQFRDAAVICASPPCTEYSYMAMPWSRSKAIARALRGQGEFPQGYTGSGSVAQLRTLFDACFRIQREAIEATRKQCPSCGGSGQTIWYVGDVRSCDRCGGSGTVTRHIPLVVENVKGAQPWVGRAKWHYGAQYLWGDVPALMPFQRVFPSPKDAGNSGVQFKNSTPLNAIAHPSKNGPLIPTFQADNGVKQTGLSGPKWFDQGAAAYGSASKERKAASALIARIPEALARHIACVFWPSE